MRRLARSLAFGFLALLAGGQGVFADTTLCREENGEISLEWSADGRCQSAPRADVAHCVKDEAAAPEHCMQCIDVPLPSETSAKSLLFSVSLPVALVIALTIAPDAPAFAGQVAGWEARTSTAFDGDRTVRLLI